MAKKNEPDQLDHHGPFKVILSDGREVTGEGSVHVTPSGGFVCIGPITGNKRGGFRDEFVRIEDGNPKTLWPVEAPPKIE